MRRNSRPAGRRTWCSSMRTTRSREAAATCRCRTGPDAVADAAGRDANPARHEALPRLSQPVRQPATSALPVRPVDDGPPLVEILFDAALRDVPQREAVRGELHVVLRIAQKPEHRQLQSFDESMQLLRRTRA